MDFSYRSLKKSARIFRRLQRIQNRKIKRGSFTQEEANALLNLAGFQVHYLEALCGVQKNSQQSTAPEKYVHQRVINLLQDYQHSGVKD